MTWRFNYHKDIEGKHAFLSPSRSTWTRYTPDRLRTVWLNNQKKQEGTFLHDLASRLIKSRNKLDIGANSTLSLFVNDCIDLQMQSEIPLFYSYNCFGTADAIKVEGKNLYIFDLKTGDKEAGFTQLGIYAALFCLEYQKEPEDLNFIFRIYQFGTYKEEHWYYDDIRNLMDIIINSDLIINALKTQ